jgi:glycosyltransferase involved in cell wall biosynthesis
VLVPCYNEEATVAAVVESFARVLPDATIYVYDNNSRDQTVARARAAGAIVRNETRQGKGNVMRRMFSDIDADIYVLVDGDDTYDAASAPALIDKLLSERLDMVVGTRFAEGGGYRGTRMRRVGIHLFAAIVSLIVRQRVTDTTSGFRAVNRRAIRLFALYYPHDYPEVEATVVLSRHGLKMVEVPVQMRIRETGNSSITAVRSVYYMVKVLLALFIGLFRRYSTPLEEP